MMAELGSVQSHKSSSSDPTSYRLLTITGDRTPNLIWLWSVFVLGSKEFGHETRLFIHSQ